MIRSRLGRAKQAIQAYKVELRFLELASSPEHRDKLRGFEKRVEDCALEAEYLEKDELTGGATQQPPAEGMTADQMLGRAADLQRQDVTMLREAIGKTEQDKQIAVDTLASMGQQREQLEGARTTVRKAETEMDLAGRQLRVFAKRMVTDKIILGILVLVALAVLVVIIVAAVKPKLAPASGGNAN